MHNSFDALLQRCILYRKRAQLRVLKTALLILAALGALVWGALSLLPQKQPLAAPVVASGVSSQHSVAASSAAPQAKDANYSVVVDEAYLLRYAQSKQLQSSSAASEPPKVQAAPQPLHVSTPSSAAEQPARLVMSTKKVSGAPELMALHEREPRYETALRIAQFYFDQQEYLLASSWAKRANILDKESEGAWILYAKSEYARGNHERAKEILQLYLSNKSSSEAQTLLMTWSQGS